MSAEVRLESALARLGLTMPTPAAPKGLYRPTLVVGALVYTSGHLPIDAAGQLLRGRLGADLDVAAGQAAARWATLGILASLRQELGRLDRIGRVVRVFGLVNSAAEFTEQPAVLNGCSELLREVFGEQAGVGVRSAVGTNTLPLGAAVEIELIAEIA